MGPGALAQVLRPLKNQTLPGLIVGLHTSDDAAVFRISEDRAIIQTVDFFTPIVDDPETYGRIAAANSMSDIYAMGGRVLFGLNVAGFPDSVPPDVIEAVFAGAASAVAEAGGAIAGGHTVVAPEPFFGLSVTGEGNPSTIWTKAGAQVGDRLYLTKPVGTGLITTAMMNDQVEPAHLERAVQSMGSLNRQVCEIGQDFPIHACTDISGFGLLGHTSEIAMKSSVGLEISFEQVPVLPGSLKYAAAGNIPGGLTRNRSYFTSQGIRFDNSVTRPQRDVLFSPETSGGLVFGIGATAGRQLSEALFDEGVECWEIGFVKGGSGIDVTA